MAQSQSGALAEERSLKDLFSEMSSQLSLLVRNEVELAKGEMQAKASLAATGGAALAIGGVAALLAVVLLSFAAAWGLAEVVPTGVGFVIVAAVWGVVAAVMLSAGKKRLAAMKPPVPEQALMTVKQDVQVAKTSFARGISGGVDHRGAAPRPGGWPR